MKLVCFSHAGGSIDFYRPLAKELPSGIELIPLEYSGHGTRRQDPLFDSMDEMTGDLKEKLVELISVISEPYAIFGYSMGAIVAAELVRQLEMDDRIPLPVHLFLAAHDPARKNDLYDYSMQEAEEVIIKRTIQFGGIPDNLYDNQVFWRMYLPLYRADYFLLREYSFEKLRINSNIPVTVFYSETDTPREVITEWSERFVADCDYHCYEGNHFFIFDHFGDIADVIKSKIGK